MQLKIRRSQRSGGVFGNKAVFILDVRAEYTPEEEGRVKKYNLGGEVIYNSQAAKSHLDRMGRQLDEGGWGVLKGAGSLILARMNLNITIASLQKGHHIECKDLSELLAAEEQVHEACKNVKAYLEAAETFDGREVIIDLDAPELAAS